MRNKFLLLFLLVANIVFAQEKITVSGTLTDQSNGETLIGATVASPSQGVGTTTNAYGFYSLSIPVADSITLVFSYIGFQPQEKRILANKDITINLELSSGVELQEVVVKANSYKEQLNDTQMSVDVITTKEAKMLPVILGESDVLKTIQLKPGIPSGSEGTTGIFVRGGGSDQNLIVLDEAVVYNANHLFGFFSTFNTDAVKDLKIYKGGFPAQYGGRLSSVIDVKLKEGNKKKFSGAGGLGVISSKLTLEAPIVKDKGSFMVSGRRTYVDILTRQINESNADNPDATLIPDYYFYDLNTKLNYQLSDKDRLYLSGYFGRDVFGFDSDFFNFDFDWGNITGTARWNHIFSPKLFANTTFTFSNYQYNIRNKIPGFSFSLGSDIEDINLKTDLHYSLNEKHLLRFGANITHHTFGISRIQGGSDDGEITFNSGDELTGYEAGIYASDEWDINKRWKIEWGLRGSAFFRENTSYVGLEPRFAARYSISDRMTLKGSYARMNQYLHLVANAGAALPTDLWYPSTAKVKPQFSDQAAIGWSYLLTDQVLTSVETYYKYLGNQLAFVDNADIYGNLNLEDEFAIGDGRAYGIEVSIEKKEGKLTGWLGYTLAFVESGNFETIDPQASFLQQGYFSPIYDRRHDFSAVAIYELSRRITLSGTYVYGSGDLRWMAPGRFTFFDVAGADFNPIIPDYGDRNNYRIPAFSRLDLGMVIHFFPSWGESDLSINVVNALDRRNVFFIYLEPEFREVDAGGGNTVQIPERVAAKQVSLFPILPSISWNFKF